MEKNSSSGREMRRLVERKAAGLCHCPCGVQEPAKAPNPGSAFFPSLFPLLNECGNSLYDVGWFRSLSSFPGGNSEFTDHP